MGVCVVKSVVAGSIAEEMEIVPGDIILEINGHDVNDVFDYKFLMADEYVEVEIIDKNGEALILEIDKEHEEDLGVEFESFLMDDPKACKNKCIFCFIDQMPKKMRKTLYFKDDDYRLSYLTGNYVTLTNTNMEEIERIIKYKMSPINISVHTTDIDLRKKMLRNNKTDNLMEYIVKLNENNIEMNGQIVLCKNYNDKENLEKTLYDLAKFIPNMKSISVVPVGLTKHRRNLEELYALGKEDCEQLVNQVNCIQKLFRKKYGTSFVFLSDEIYLKAGLMLPKYREYEKFPQLENGVGMVSLFEKEFDTCLRRYKGDEKIRNLSIATGELAKDFVQSLCAKINKKFINTSINVYSICNDFFGELITVSGLVTATDIIGQLNGKELGSLLLVPTNMLRKDTAMFLDNLTVTDVEQALKLPVKAVDVTGTAFVKSILY